LINSEIGETYFKYFDAKRMLATAINKKEIDISLDINDECTGFIWYNSDGAFGMHGYLHIIAIKEKHRNQGIGSELIKHCENSISEEDDKLLLLVAEFNRKAKMLYERMGYKQVGLLPDFYKEGIDECLMMKNLSK
jgi:ribosomal protein S18 acetylase RimI-like enzyme